MEKCCDWGNIVEEEEEEEEEEDKEGNIKFRQRYKAKSARGARE